MAGPSCDLCVQCLRRSEPTWGSKPMSSMRSASSRARKRIWDRDTRALSIRSLSRPGVATRMSQPRSSSLSCTPHAHLDQHMGPESEEHHKCPEHNGAATLAQYRQSGSPSRSLPQTFPHDCQGTHCMHEAPSIEAPCTLPAQILQECCDACWI